MSLCVLSYPNIERKDFDWIQSLRSRHEKTAYALVKPHVTLVFPSKAVSDDVFIKHVRGVASQTEPISLVIRCAAVNPGATADFWNVFLVPDEGYSNIVKLHSRLYTGPLASELRYDLSYVPHITVAGRSDPQACRDLADEINSKNICIRGRLDTADIVAFEPGTLSTLEQVDFAGGR